MLSQDSQVRRNLLGTQILTLRLCGIGDIAYMSMNPSKRHRLKQKTSICLVQSYTPGIYDYCGTIRHVNTQWVLLRNKLCCPRCGENAVFEIGELFGVSSH
jgi:hypothetical protein